MFCKKCGNPVPDGAEICQTCGEPCSVPMTSGPDVLTDAQPVASQPSEQAPSYLSADTPMSAETGLPETVEVDHPLITVSQKEGDMSGQFSKKSRSKVWLKAAVITGVALLLVAALTVATAFGVSSISGKYDREIISKAYVVCVTDDDRLYLIDGSNGTRYLISENFEADVFNEMLSGDLAPYRLTEDGKRFFYLEYNADSFYAKNNFKLSYRDLTDKGVSDAVTVKDHVVEYKLDNNGTVYYTAYQNEANIALCINDFKNGEKRFGTLVTEFYVSDNGSLVHYVDESNTLYRVTDNGAEFIDENIETVQSHYRTDGTVYYIKNGAYMCARPDSSKPVAIALTGRLVSVNDDGTFYYTDRPYIAKGNFDDAEDFTCYEAARSEDFKSSEYIKSSTGDRYIIGESDDDKNEMDSFGEIYYYLIEQNTNKVYDFLLDWFGVENAYLASYNSYPGYGHREGYLSGLFSGYRYGAFAIYGSTEENDYKNGSLQDMLENEYDLSEYLADIPEADKDWTVADLVLYYNRNGKSRERNTMLKELFGLSDGDTAYIAGFILGFAQGYELGYEDFYVFENGSNLYYYDGSASTEVLSDYYETVFIESSGGKLAVRTTGSDGECWFVYKDKATAVNPDTDDIVRSVYILPDSNIIYAFTEQDAEDAEYDSWRSVTDGAIIGKWVKDYEGFSLYDFGGNGLPVYFEGEILVEGDIIRSGKTLSYNSFEFILCPYGNTDGMVTFGEYDSDTDSCKLSIYDGRDWYDIDENASYATYHIGYVSETCVYFVTNASSEYYSGNLKCWFEGDTVDLGIRNAYYLDVLVVLEQ